MGNKKSEYKLAIFGGFIGVVFTAVYDLIKEKPILSTLLNILKWIWFNIMEFEVTVWQIIVGLITIIFILYLFSLKKEFPINNFDDWFSYENDTIHNVQWNWQWEKNPLTGKWNVNDLRPICHSCGTKMHLEESSWSSKFADCPRCGTEYYDRKDLRKIEAVILDNVRRGIYPKQELN